MNPCLEYEPSSYKSYKHSLIGALGNNKSMITHRIFNSFYGGLQRKLNLNYYQRNLEKQSKSIESFVINFCQVHSHAFGIPAETAISNIKQYVIYVLHEQSIPRLPKTHNGSSKIERLRKLCEERFNYSYSAPNIPNGTGNLDVGLNPYSCEPESKEETNGTENAQRIEAESEDIPETSYSLFSNREVTRTPNSPISDLDPSIESDLSIIPSELQTPPTIPTQNLLDFEQQEFILH